MAGQSLNLFFDGGGGKMVCSHDAAEKLALLGRADHISQDPLILRGVNNQTSICPYGEYSIRLPLKNGEDATFTGICVDEVTESLSTHLRNLRLISARSLATALMDSRPVPCFPGFQLVSEEK